MRRKEFLRVLKIELNKRIDIETEEVLFYYDELIQDAIDSGENEEVFIANLGTPREILRRLEDDEEFIINVKSKNDINVKNAVSSGIKIIGYAVMVFVAFILTIISFSLFVSGISVVGATIVKMIVIAPIDIYGYIALVGAVLIGLSLIIFSIGIVKWFMSFAKPTLLLIFRNTKELINRKGK